LDAATERLLEIIAPQPDLCVELSALTVAQTPAANSPSYHIGVPAG